MSKICVIVFFYLSISLANCYKDYCDMYSTNDGFSYRNVTCETPNLCCGTCYNRWCCNDSDLYLNQTSCNNKPYIWSNVIMDSIVQALITFCILCCPFLSVLLCVFLCYLQTGLNKIKQKLCGRRRRRQSFDYPNVRNSINNTIDLEEASIYDIIDDNISNNHRPNILFPIPSIDSNPEQNNPPPAYYLVKDIDPNLPSYESIFTTNGKFQTSQM